MQTPHGSNEVKRTPPFSPADSSLRFNRRTTAEHTRIGTNVRAGYKVRKPPSTIKPRQPRDSTTKCNCDAD